MNLLDTILNSQDGAVVRQLANRLQLDEDQTRSAVGALLPALTRGISRNASSPQGLDQLIGALANGNHGRYIEQPQALGGEAAVEEGNGILGHVFGSKDVSRQVASRAAQTSGVDSGLLKQMLPLIASAAMGALAKNGFGAARAQAESAPGAPDANAGIGGLLNSFLDADKDGSVVDDILGMAGRFLR
jgi:hypothetical protein